jgi:hypothetical protein
VVDVRLDPLIGAIVLDEMRARWWRYLWQHSACVVQHVGRLADQRRADPGLRVLQVRSDGVAASLWGLARNSIKNGAS